MDQIFSSAALVTFAEMGDKTQLLSIILAARYKKFWPIFFGILLATLFNHAVAAYVGQVTASYASQQLINYVTAATFIILGFWILVPDKAPQLQKKPKYGAFVASLVAFFLAEMGDKTQIATISLGAKYTSILMVTIGTTIGMMLANIPAILFGNKIMKLVPINNIRFFACILFVAFGLYILITK